MKINNITFGQTYYSPSINRYMTPGNKQKIFYSDVLGDIYPIDMLLGANNKGDLTVQIRHASNWDYLIKNDLVPLTDGNIGAYYLIKGFEAAGEDIHGSQYPILKSTIKDIKNKDKQEIKYEILDKIIDYYHKYGKTFIN